MDRNRVLLFAAAVFVSWLVEYIHNRFELPQLTLLSPENSLVFLIGLVLFLFWWLSPMKRQAATLLLIWGLLHLIGGGVLSVLPLPFLPFYPEQSLQHYLTHLINIATQIPLILIAYRELRRDNPVANRSL